jgi:hypothetical protein
MLEVGCPEPALALERIESTRNWAANSATMSRPTRDAGVVAMVKGATVSHRVASVITAGAQSCFRVAGVSPFRLAGIPR